MIETNYVPNMKIYHICFVIKGQFPVMDCISNTIILYFMSILLHNMYALISYATYEWPEMHNFQQSYVLFCNRI